MFSFANTIYPITDTRISGLSHAEQVTRLIAGGARLIQLREKHASPREFFADAQAALANAHSHGAQLIINDRVDLAIALGADGVHLGQTDLPVEAARRLLGLNAIIGFSVHNIEQAKLALEMPIDYLALGPIFPTTTKQNPDPVVGLAGMRQVREIAGGLPLVGIGGIRADNVNEVLAAGADAVALISSLLQDPLQITARLQTLMSAS
jgi:thiamine-phosphate pyrophosphorylase